MDKPKKINSGFLLLGALLIAATALFVFGWLAEEMLEGDTQQFDAYLRTAVHQHATPGPVDAGILISWVSRCGDRHVLGGDLRVSLL